MANTFNNAKIVGLGTTATILYTVPVGTTTTIIGMTLANKIATGVRVDVEIISGVDIINISKGMAVPTNETYVPVGGVQKLVLKAGEQIRVKSDTAASIDVFASMLEISA